jgi:hypothetical protein
MVIRGFGADLWRIRAESYNTRGDTVAAGAIHVEGLRGRAARIVEALGTPAAGLRPRPTREKGFSF